MHRTVADFALAALAAPAFEGDDGVFHPVCVVAIRIIFLHVRAAAFLAVGGRLHRDHCLRHQIVELECFNQISIPDQRAIGDADIRELGVDLVHRCNALAEQIIVPEHGGMRLHGFLHFEAQVRSWNRTFGIAEMV